MANPSIKKTFGLSVRTWRKRLGISQEELAGRASLHRTYICDVERGARNVSLESIAKLAQALEISVPSLLCYTTDPDSGKLMSATPVGGEMVDILFIEDLADDVTLTLAALKAANISNRIHVVHDGAAALDYLFGTEPSETPTENDIPHLILLDLGLPKVNGLEVLRRIKRDSRTNKIPVIVLTASLRDRDLALSKQLGADGYIVKPVDFQNLSEVTPTLRLQWALLKSAPIPSFAN